MSTHILMFPYPAQGHIIPMLNLAHQLSIHGLTLTILVTPKNLPILNSLLESHPSIQTLVLPFPKYPSIPEGVENMRDLGNVGTLPMINALGLLRGPIIQWFKDHPNPPVAILSDFFLGWTLNLANELGIPRLVFYSSGAFLTAVLNFIWKDVKATLSLPMVKFHDLPKSPVFMAEEIPSTCRKYKESDPKWEFLKDGMVANMSSYGFVINTFDALEGVYMSHLKEKLGHSRVWGVGPLMGYADAYQCLDSEKLAWLDNCPDGSVLYVCFGSQKFLNKAQMKYLADGLEKSEARFIWVVKSLTAQQEASGYGSIPDGFEDRACDRGLIIKGWAPQPQILSHRAVAEGVYMSYLKEKLGHSRVWGVGPLMGYADADQCLDSEKLAWLDNCPDGSVLYVCFGSQKFLNKAQMKDLADGLEKSEARFIWVVKILTAQQEASGYGSIPDGSEDRVCDRGLIIKEWVPQAQILSHTAVAGFLSHCGWNSLLEGIMAGVTMLTWPMEADQFVNARLLEEDVGSAIRVCQGSDSVPDSTALARSIAESMRGVTKQKLNAEKLRDNALEAVGKNGSSALDLDNLVKDLIEIQRV